MPEAEHFVTKHVNTGFRLKRYTTMLQNYVLCCSMHTKNSNKHKETSEINKAFVLITLHVGAF